VFKVANELTGYNVTDRRSFLEDQHANVSYSPQFRLSHSPSLLNLCPRFLSKNTVTLVKGQNGRTEIERMRFRRSLLGVTLRDRTPNKKYEIYCTLRNGIRRNIKLNWKLHEKRLHDSSSSSIPVAPTWSIGHPRKFSFHFSFLI
jgi:hypothetical protein